MDKRKTKTGSKNVCKKHLTLICVNDERKNHRFLSAKACGVFYNDSADCYDGAIDTCYASDTSACAGSFVYDTCKYVDQESCHGSFVSDYCESDYDVGNNCDGSDFCMNIDY